MQPGSNHLAEAISLVEKNRRKNLSDKETKFTWDRLQEIKTEIEKTYKEKGIEISEEELDHSLEQYYQTKVGPEFPINSKTTELAEWLIANSKKLDLTAKSMVVIIILVLFGGGIHKIVDNSNKQRIESSQKVQVEEALEVAGKIQEIVSTQEKKVNYQAGYLETGIEILDRESIQPIRRDLLEIGTNIFEESGKIRQEPNLPKKSRKSQKLLSKVKTQFQPKFQNLENLLNAKLSMVEISNQIESTNSESPEIKKDLQKAKDQIKLGSIEGVEKAKTYLQSITSTIEKKKASGSLQSQIRETVIQWEQTASKTATPGSRELVQEQIDQVNSTYSQGDIELAKLELTRLHNIIGLINSYITLKITQNPEKKTGFWRNHPGGARVYYLSVNAKDNHGNPILISIINEETGKTELTSNWAEQVSEQEFEKIKSEKQAYGNLKTDTLANKPKGAAAFEYILGPKINGQEQTKGRITSW